MKSFKIGATIVLAFLLSVSSFAMSKFDIIEAIRNIAKINNVNEVLALSIAEVESSFNPKALRYEPKFKTYSVGLFQIFVPTSRTLGFTGTHLELQEPKINIELGIKHLRICTDRFKDNIARIACCHNAGSAVKESVCQNNAHVKEYVRKVLYAYEKRQNDALALN
jgi:soluble lytic murein transglycosylase-like protein